MYAYLHKHSNKLADKFASKLSEHIFSAEHADALAQALVTTIGQALQAKDSALTKELVAAGVFSEISEKNSDERVSKKRKSSEVDDEQSKGVETGNKNTSKKEKKSKNKGKNKQVTENSSKTEEPVVDEGATAPMADTSVVLGAPEADESVGYEINDVDESTTSRLSEKEAVAPVLTAGPNDKKKPAQGQRFQRVKSDQIHFIDDRMRDMSYASKV